MEMAYKKRNKKKDEKVKVNKQIKSLHSLKIERERNGVS
jgi:hypothetical protein